MSRRTALWIVLAVGALLHALVTFPNHWLFRTYALDLGLYTHTAWHYLHGRVHDGTLFQAEPTSMLADHFDLYLILFSPLLVVFGTWTLLVVQWISIIVGALGVRSCLLAFGLSERHGLCGAGIMLCFFGVFAASAFDYHSNVVASMVLPWFLSALLRERRSAAVLLCAAMLIAKENMGLWVGVVAMVFAHEKLLPPSMRRFSRVLGTCAFGWSALIILVVMPAITKDGQYAHFDYPLVAALFHSDSGHPRSSPWMLVQALFLDLSGAPNGTAIKVEFWLILMLSGGWAMLRSPRWFLMALPLLAQRMWHNEPSKWAVFGQYSIEFAPLVAIALPLALSHWTQHASRSWILWLAPIITACCTVRTMDNTVAYHDKSRLRFYQAQHYRRSYDVELVRSVLDTIPADRAVSAQSPAVPHLALRERLYQYPIISDAELILLLPQESSYPLDTTTYRLRMDSLMRAPGWIIEHQDLSLVLLRRRVDAL